MSVVLTGVHINKLSSNLDIDSVCASIKSALESSQIEIDESSSHNIGIFLGTTFTNFHLREENAKKYFESGARVINPTLFPRSLISYLGGHFAAELSIKGCNSTFSSGVSSGLDALAQGLYFTKRNINNKALVLELGDNMPDESTYIFKESVSWVVENRDNKKNEYINIVCLESCFDNKHKNSGLIKAIEKALSRAGLGFDEIDYVFASGCNNQDKYKLARDAAGYFGATEKHYVAFNPQENNYDYGLFFISNILTNIKFSVYTKAKSINVMFINLGEDTNSSCLIAKI